MLLQLLFSINSFKYRECISSYSNQFLKSSVSIIILLFISLCLCLFLPVRNMNLGDGIILLEHVALEARVFGYHLTMDEILEALIHSILFARFQSIFPTPIEAYQYVSTSCGFLALGILFYFFRKFKITIIGYFIVLSSGGMYLFHGYNENYTITTTVLWLYILYTLQSIRSNRRRNLYALLPICLIACFSILLHLVSGYIILSLIYLCYFFSDKGKFIRNAFSSTLFSLVLLAPIFLYFIFISEVRFDFTQTHVTNPKFYPISKIISINHFSEILYCILGSAFLSFILLLFFTLFYRNMMVEILKRPDFRFLSFVLLGFLVHGFVFYPQLGFPADWDLLTFYWTPMVFLSVLILKELSDNPDYKNLASSFAIECIPMFIFTGLIFVFNAIYLNKPSDYKIVELNYSLDRINRFSNSNEIKFLGKISPNYKKFYVKASFFLFETREKIKDLSSVESNISQRLLNDNSNYQKELEKNIERVDKKWQKDFYSRLTQYNLEYSELLKKK